MGRARTRENVMLPKAGDGLNSDEEWRPIIFASITALLCQTRAIPQALVVLGPEPTRQTSRGTGRIARNPANFGAHA
ncbi:hypothetical protein NL676_031523 [Syzygium grande]|nr:hypothetical protein NL676_031523 [Syzygium grande]